MKKDIRVGNSGIAGGLVWIMRCVMSSAVKGVVLMGLVLCASACSSSDDEGETDPVFEEGKIKGHEYVDLGLSVKWATCNVGASSPSDYGNYFAWGEVSTKRKYTEGNSKTYGKSYGDIGGNSSTDAARANWGGSWRLPTDSECEELVDNCTWTWTTMNGKNGCKVTGRNGNSIFLPAAGCCNGSSRYLAGSGGYYWGSTPHESDTNGAYSLNFGSGSHDVRWNNRYFGRSVRPVSE